MDERVRHRGVERARDLRGDLQSEHRHERAVAFHQRIDVPVNNSPPSRSRRQGIERNVLTVSMRRSRLACDNFREHLIQ